MKKFVLKLILGLVLMLAVLPLSSFASTGTVKVTGVTLIPGKYYEVPNGGELINIPLDAAPKDYKTIHLSADSSTLTLNYVSMNTRKEEDFIWTDLEHLTIELDSVNYINNQSNILKGHGIVGNNVTIKGGLALDVFSEEGIELTGDLVIYPTVNFTSAYADVVQAANVYIKAFSTTNFNTFAHRAFSPGTNVIIDPLPESYSYMWKPNTSLATPVTDISPYIGTNFTGASFSFGFVRNAITDGQLRIYRTLVTQQNAADILLDGTMSYDFNTKTLYMNNVNFTESFSTKEPFIESKVEGLNIAVQGNNSVTNSDNAGKLIMLYYDAIIKGGGTLNLKNESECIQSYQDSSSGEAVVNLTVEDVTLNATSYGNAISQANSNSAKLNLIVKDGAVINAESTSNYNQEGIDVNSINISGGSVTAKGVIPLSVNGFGNGSFVMTGGKLNAITIPHSLGWGHRAGIHIHDDTEIIEMHGGEITVITENLQAIRMGDKPILMTGGTITAQAESTAIIDGIKFENLPPNVQLADGLVLDFEAGDSADNITTTDISTYTGSKYVRLEIGYPLYVGNVMVTPQNADSITGGGITAGTASYNLTEGVLSLDNVNVATTAAGIPAIDSKLANLTINLKGNNTLSATGTGVNAINTSGLIALTGDGTLTAQGSSAAFSTAPSSVALAGGLTYQLKAGEQESSAALIASPTDTDYTSNKYVKFEIGYPLVIGGMFVTPQNSSSIPTKSGTAYYDPYTKTVTLDNAILESDTAGKAVVEILGENMTIENIGTNSIVNTNSTAANSDAISAKFPFTISGEGVLNAKSGTNSSYAVTGKATITGGKQSFIGSAAAFSQTPIMAPIYGSMPQISGNADFSGTEVGIAFMRFNAEKSTLPSYTRVVITPLDAQTVQRLQKEMQTTDGTAEPTLYVDIKLLNDDHMEVQPTAGTVIHLDIPHIKAGDNITFVHEITNADGTMSYEKVNLTAVESGFSFAPTSLSPFGFYRILPVSNPALAPLTGVYS